MTPSKHSVVLSTITNRIEHCRPTVECGLRCDQLVARYGRAGKRALNIGVMADEGGKAVIVEVVDIGATVHFPPLASALCGPLNGLLERSRVHAADARRGRWV
jgi:hypothetical protein